jgi:hypothetical protein
MTRWQRLPAIENKDALVRRAMHLRLVTPRGERKRSLDELARSAGITERSLYRYLRDYLPCPGYPEGSCLTKVQGGGLCSFCRRSKALA